MHIKYEFIQRTPLGRAQMCWRGCGTDTHTAWVPFSPSDQHPAHLVDTLLPFCTSQPLHYLLLALLAGCYSFNYCQNIWASHQDFFTVKKPNRHFRAAQA